MKPEHLFCVKENKTVALKDALTRHDRVASHEPQMTSKGMGVLGVNSLMEQEAAWRSFGKFIQVEKKTISCSRELMLPFCHAPGGILSKERSDSVN